jgi:MFS family permease
MEATAVNSWSMSAYGRLLRDNRDFRLLWSAQIVSEIGDWFFAVAVYSLLLEITGQAKSVGLAVVLQLLPQVFMAPFAGILNDRLNRRTVMIFADVARFFIILAMLLVRGPELVWFIYFLLFLETTMWALFEPGRQAIIPKLCSSRDEVLVANALSSMTWSFNLAVGASIGGIVAWQFGRDTVFIIDAFTFLLSAWFLRRMAVRETHADHLPALRIGDLFDYTPMIEGLKYVARDGRMLATLLVKTGMGVLGAHWVILPMMGERVFVIKDSGALSMSLLMGARGVGALIGSLMSGYLGRNEPRRMRTVILIGFITVSISYVALGAAPTLVLACTAVIIGHAGTSLNWVFSTTMLQQMTDDRYRGRVFSADFAGLFLMMAAVSFLASTLVDLGLSIRMVAAGTGLLGLLPATLWAIAQRRLWPRS